MDIISIYDHERTMQFGKFLVYTFGLNFLKYQCEKSEIW